ncbi:hypothetical protein C8F04DRAFT_1120721 [Mycena alexandri]|uniref:Uncharacterized protein n=1 Tax=Mycena alexandri TaxID=1745969 RepID=A0AAD6SJH7_9AGAR|nr:hypothetical protein C8F04DRAFT_1120721 [Mycena alexandri]
MANYTTRRRSASTGPLLSLPAQRRVPLESPEPDEEWKSNKRVEIENDFKPIIQDAKDRFEAGMHALTRDSPDYAARRGELIEAYDVECDSIRNLAREEFMVRLADERLLRRVTTGGIVNANVKQSMVDQQAAVLAQIQRNNRRNSTPPVAQADIASPSSSRPTVPTQRNSDSGREVPSLAISSSNHSLDRESPSTKSLPPEMRRSSSEQSRIAASQGPLAKSTQPSRAFLAIGISRASPLVEDTGTETDTEEKSEVGGKFLRRTALTSPFSFSSRPTESTATAAASLSGTRYSSFKEASSLSSRAEDAGAAEQKQRVMEAEKLATATATEAERAAKEAERVAKKLTEEAERKAEEVRPKDKTAQKNGGEKPERDLESRVKEIDKREADLDRRETAIRRREEETRLREAELRRQEAESERKFKERDADLTRREAEMRQREVGTRLKEAPKQREEAEKRSEGETSWSTSPRASEKEARLKEAEKQRLEAESERKLKEIDQRQADLRRREAEMMRRREEETRLKEAAQQRGEAERERKEKERVQAEAEKQRLEREQQMEFQKREAEIKERRRQGSKEAEINGGRSYGAWGLPPRAASAAPRSNSTGLTWSSAPKAGTTPTFARQTSAGAANGKPPWAGALTRSISSPYTSTSASQAVARPSASSMSRPTLQTDFVSNPPLANPEVWLPPSREDQEPRKYPARSLSRVQQYPGNRLNFHLEQED